MAATLPPKGLDPASTNDRSPLSIFAALASVGAFLVATLAVVVVVAKDSGVSTVKTESAAPISVTLTEYAIDPEPIVAPPGKVTLAVRNAGTQAHNLAVKGPDKRTKNLNSNNAETIELTDMAVGSYEILCEIPGHADSGMKGKLDIVEGAETQSAAGSTDGMTHSSSANAFGPDADKAMIEGANKYVKAVVDSLTAAEGLPTSNGGVGAQGVPTVGRGNQKLEPVILPDGTKEFILESSIVDWETEPGKIVKAWAYNGIVPGPWIRVEPNDKVKVTITNNLPIGTDIHFHGISTPFKADGVAPITQEMISTGNTYSYEFTAPNNPELGMYHAHNHGHVSVLNGLFAIFQVGDVELPLGRTINGRTVPADLKPAQELAMVVNDAGVIGLSLNGKAFPATDPVVTKVGDWTEVHYYNEGLMAHPMHLHRLPQLVVARDGIPLESPFWVDTLNVAAGERYTVLIESRPGDIDLSDPAKPGPGIWAYHCHILNHAENDNGLFGMVTAFVVLPA